MIAWFFFIFNAQAESPASLDLDGLTPILERQAKPRSYTGEVKRVAHAPADGLRRLSGEAADPSSLVQEQNSLRSKRGLLQADNGAVSSKRGLLQRRSNIQALQVSLRNAAKEKATLESTLKYKGEKKNTKQDFQLYELDAQNNYYENMDNWLKANKELVDGRLASTTKSIEGNKTYVKWVHDEEKKLWQELANSLVWTVRSY